MVGRVGPGGPIDVLFLDLLKTWEINDAVLRDFFPQVVPGQHCLRAPGLRLGPATLAADDG